MNKRILIIFGVILLLLIVIAVFFKIDKSPTSNNGIGAAPDMNFVPASPAASQTKGDVPENVTAPSQGVTDLPKDVAVPNTVTTAGPNTTAQLRVFKTNLSSSGFSPLEFIVNQKDTARIDITAIDAEYKVSQPDYGLSQTIAKGAEKMIQFDANESGKFTILCDNCANKNIKAFVTVVPKK